MTDLERAARLLDDERFKRCFQWWPVNVTDYKASGVVAEHIAAARREGAEAERAEWMSCARVDAMMEGPALKGWYRSALDRLWRRGITPEEPPTKDSTPDPLPAAKARRE